jgi:restriction system protein
VALALLVGVAAIASNPVVALAIAAAALIVYLVGYEHPSNRPHDFEVQAFDKSDWNLELLRALEWRRFEILCRAYFEKRGFRSRTTRFGADGGVDIHVYEEGTDTPILVQCKAWNTYRVGIKPVRELLGVMTIENVRKGVLITTGKFTNEARELAAQVKGLALIDGEDFLQRIHSLNAEERRDLIQLATEGDFTTPTCPSCGIKMMLRESRKDASTFWGCSNYPRCKQTFSIKRTG